MTRRIPYAPAEGWLTLGLVTFMCITLAWAVDDARWVLGREGYLDMLVLLAVGGVLAGFIGPKVGWGRWKTYLVGSIFAALIVPLLTGLVAFPDGASPHDLFQATSASVVAAFVDIVLTNLPVTTQYLHHILIIGLLVWATSMFASYAVFGHRRPLSAVVLVGVILVGNMAITYNDQLAYLIMFSVASLFLLIRSHVFDEQSEWVRRRIGDPTTISAVYLRGGTVFIGVAVAASVLLTATAASAPLAGAWNGVEDRLLSVSQSLARFLPTGGSTRPIGLTFGENTAVSQQWVTDQGVALTIQRDPTDKGSYYWRVRTYDQISPKGWGTTKPTKTDVAAGARTFEGMSEDVDPLGLHSFTFIVNPDGYREPLVVAPQTPIQVDEAVTVATIGIDRYYSAIERKDSGPYTVTVLWPILGNDDGMFNQAALREAGTDYPDEIRELYLPASNAENLGPSAKTLENKIVSQARSDAPIDLAVAAVAELQSSTYQYSTDLRDLPCENLSWAECFASFRKGFCQQYAVTMAVILRDLGVPTRIAQGFLPGARGENAASEEILNSNAHAWVEVYFPGYGWVPFDPTSPDVARLAPLPSGPPADGSPRPSRSAGPIASIPPAGQDLLDRPPGVIGSVPTAGSLGPMVGVLALLGLIVGGVAFLAWQRGPRGATSPDGAYGTVTRIASRLGFAPKPAQTVYEYAGSLGDVLPEARPELETVARAKVESVYARQILGADRLAALTAAHRRLRVSLLRLAFRRKQRPRR